MIVWHTHHIIPKRMGGTDDRRNLLRCNVVMHAFMHKLLWEKYGQKQDYRAWRWLSIMAPISQDIQRKQVESNRKQVEAGTHPFLGGDVSRRNNKKMIAKGTHPFIRPGFSEFMTKQNLRHMKEGTNPLLFLTKEQLLINNKKTAALKKLGMQTRSTCPHCGKTGQTMIMGRWHFDNCKKRRKS